MGCKCNKLEWFCFDLKKKKSLICGSDLCLCSKKESDLSFSIKRT